MPAPTSGWQRDRISCARTSARTTRRLLEGESRSQLQLSLAKELVAGLRGGREVRAREEHLVHQVVLRRVDLRDVRAVEHVEGLEDQLELHALGELESARQP